MNAEELEKEITEKQKQLANLRANEIAIECDFKVGDEVEFIAEDWDHRDYKTYQWEKRKITRINRFDKKSPIVVSLSGLHDTIQISKIKLFDKDDYTMRHSLWERELYLGDDFQLIVEKPKSTKGRIYQVHKIIKSIDSPTEYYYYNDYGKVQTLHEGEFHVTTEKI